MTLWTAMKPTSHFEYTQLFQKKVGGISMALAYTLYSNTRILFGTGAVSFLNFRAVSISQSTLAGRYWLYRYSQLKGAFLKNNKPFLSY